MNSNLNNEFQPEAFQGIDLDKLKNLFQKSIYWIIAILIFTNLTAYLIIRWTKPLFVSASEIKLDLKSDASELGIGFVENQNLNLISGEIELIKSRLFFGQVIDAMDLKTSYYTMGQVLNDEKYKSSPFIVDTYIKSPSAYNQKYYIDLVSNENFLFSESEDFKNAALYKYGEIVEANNLDFKVNLRGTFNNATETKHFFIINSQEALLNYIERNLTVEPINFNANTIRISFKDHNPLKAHEIVNVIDSVYLKFSNLEKSQENKQKIDYLNHQLGQIELLLENYEDYFEDFTLKYRTNDLDQDLKLTLGYINELDSQKFNLLNRLEHINQTSRMVNQEEINFINLHSDLPKNIQESIQELNHLIEDLNKVKLFYKETTAAYSSKAQKVNDAKEYLSTQLNSYRTSINESLEEIESRRARLEQNFAQIPEKSTEYNKKQRFFKLYEEFYLSLMQTKAEFEIAQAGTTPDFKILSPASMPVAPVSPNRLIIHGIGLVSGLIIGFLFIALRYILNNKIISISELERLTNTAILGTVPVVGYHRLAKLLIQNEPRSAVSESLRTIRTNIEFMLAGKEKKILSVTSTVGGEGKTFVAVNLSAIIALSKKKVIVVDLDLRKPRIHDAFGEDNNAKGVSTILINKHSIEESIRPTSVKNLDYIPAGPTPPNPSELLINGEFDDFLKSLSEKYDIVVVDTPPVGIVTDGILVMRKVHLPIYVFRANYSKKEFLRTFNRIQNVNNVPNPAVILNAVPHMISNYYGSGYYEEKSKSTRFAKFKWIFSNS